MEEMEPHGTPLELDQPRDTDYEYEEVFWDTEKKGKLNVPLITIQNQWADKFTRMACGQFWLTHIMNAQNKIEYAIKKLPFTEYQAIDFWREIVKITPTAEFVGSSLQGNLDFHRKAWRIAWYAKVSTKEQIIAALDAQHYIYTGSYHGDWKDVRSFQRYKIREDGAKVPHITSYFTYVDEGVKGLNSYWKDDGTFIVPWAIFLSSEYFTKYAVIDNWLDDVLLSYKVKKNLL